MSDEIKGRVAQYYSERIAAHGATPAGVDWNGEASQTLRFAQLMKIAEGSASYSLNDAGCGYGALLAYLEASDHTPDYLGYDLSATMVATAQQQFAGRPHTRFVHGDHAGRVADFAVASGLLSVKQDVAVADWEAFIFSILAQLHAESRLGFAFNCLTSYSDADKMRPHLYYGDPCRFFDYCKRNFSRNIALLHDYGLYEFTILVRKDG